MNPYAFDLEFITRYSPRWTALVQLVDFIEPDMKDRLKEFLIYSDHPVIAEITFEVSKALLRQREFVN